MAVTFQAAGAIGITVGSGVGVMAPACVADDVLIAAVWSKTNDVVTVPAGWTKFVEVNNTALQRLTLAWKRAVAADSGAIFAFTGAVTTWRALISTYRGCNVTAATPIDAAAPSTSANASADAVTYATFDPVETAAFVVAVGVYNLSQTTAGAIAGVDPTFVNDWDLEDASGSTASIFGYSGASTGAITGARSHSTTSVTDAINTGVLFGLVAAVVPGAPTGLSATAISPGRINLSWTTPVSDGGSPLTGYKIERETPVAGGFMTLVANTGQAGTAFFDTACAPSTQYNYRVSAVNGVGASSASAAANATTSAAPAVPSAVRNLLGD